MRFSSTSSRFSASVGSISQHFSRWFPTPRLLVPLSAGIDISDASIKWVVLDRLGGNLRVINYGFERLAVGIVADGIIHEEEALVLALARVRSRLGGINHVHAALPEEAAYVFSMHVPEESDRGQIISMIEFESEDRVPVPVNASVYDYDIITKHDGDIGEEVGVSVFPRELAEAYTSVFDAAGFELQSLEIEAQSIARAISNRNSEEPITLSVDFGRDRTGFAVIKKGIPIFTSTIKVGAEEMTRKLIEKLSLSSREAEVFKNEEGLLAEGGIKNPGVEALIGTASALADEVAKLYHYWDTRRNDKGVRMTPLGRVFIMGGGANLKGLADYISERVQAPAMRPNVWQNVCTFNDYIPPIDRRASLQYAAAIGLALRSF